MPRLNSKFQYLENPINPDEILIISTASLMPEVTEANHSPRDICFLLDISGSMKGDRLENAKNTILGLIDKLDDNEYVSLKTFNNIVTEILPNLRKSDITEEHLQKIRNIAATGGTAIYDAIRSITPNDFAQDSSSGCRTTLILTDGKDQHSRNTIGGVNRLIHEYNNTFNNKAPRFLTIGMGQYDEDFISGLANASSCPRFEITNTLQLNDERSIITINENTARGIHASFEFHIQGTCMHIENLQIIDEGFDVKQPPFSISKEILSTETGQIILQHDTENVLLDNNLIEPLTDYDEINTAISIFAQRQIQIINSDYNLSKKEKLEKLNFLMAQTQNNLINLNGIDVKENLTNLINAICESLAFNEIKKLENIFLHKCFIDYHSAETENGKQTYTIYFNLHTDNEIEYPINLFDEAANNNNPSICNIEPDRIILCETDGEFSLEAIQQLIDLEYLPKLEYNNLENIIEMLNTARDEFIGIAIRNTQIDIARSYDRQPLIYSSRFGLPNEPAFDVARALSSNTPAVTPSGMVQSSDITLSSCRTRSNEPHICLSDATGVEYAYAYAASNNNPRQSPS